MLTAYLALVHDHDIAGRKPVQPVALDAVLHRDAQIGQEDRQTTFILRNHARLGIQQAAAEIAHLENHHVIGRLAQRDRHLVRIRIYGVAYDFNRNWIDLHSS